MEKRRSAPSSEKFRKVSESAEVPDYPSWLDKVSPILSDYDEVINLDESAFFWKAIREIAKFEEERRKRLALQSWLEHIAAEGRDL